MAREMLLVDPAMLESLQTNSHLRPTSQNIATRVIQETDNDINNILASDMKPSEQVLHYNQALQKRDQYADKTAARIFQQKLLSGMNTDNQTEHEVDEIKPVDSMEEEIIESVPKSMASKALRLVKKMKQGGILGWNAYGNLTYKGEDIPNTNVVDIVNDVLRKRKNKAPVGWGAFAQGMQETNVPQDLIGNPDRYNSTPPRSRNEEFHTPAASMTPQQKRNTQSLPKLKFGTEFADLSPLQKVKRRREMRAENESADLSPLQKVQRRRETRQQQEWLRKES